jgi:hypothetical protein
MAHWHKSMKLNAVAPSQRGELFCAIAGMIPAMSGQIGF